MANVYMGTDLEAFIFDESATYEESSCKKEEAEDKKEVKEEGSVEEEVVEVTDEEINTCGVIECVDDPEVACYRIALENEQNYNSIMNAFMVKEFSVLESTGSEMIYEAVDVQNFFASVKKTINLWWSKIQGVIKRVMEEISKRTDLNRAFVEKYTGKDIKTPENAKEFKGYDFSKVSEPEFVSVANLVESAVAPSKIVKVDDAAAEEFMTSFKSKFEETKEYMRGAACGDMNRKVSSDDFDKELRIAFFGSAEKVSVSLLPFSTLLSELSGAKDAKAKAKSAYKKAQDVVKKLQQEVKVAEGGLKKSDKKNAGMKIAKCLTDSINASLGILSKAMSVYTKSMVARVMQDRAMAMYYITNQPKKEKAKDVKESAVDFEDLGIVLR